VLLLEEEAVVAVEVVAAEQMKCQKK